MTTEEDKQRAAAICKHCGSCHVVRIRPDGTTRVIGTSGGCACGKSDYRILGADGPEPDDPGEAAPVIGESKGA